MKLDSDSLQSPEPGPGLQQLVNAGCSPENRTLVRALSVASAKEQHTWFSAASGWLASQEFCVLPREAVEDIAQFACVHVTKENSQIFGKFVVKLC